MGPGDRPGNPQLPVAVASGFLSDELRTQAVAAGVKELIFKAASVEDLCDALARIANTACEASRI